MKSIEKRKTMSDLQSLHTIIRSLPQSLHKGLNHTTLPYLSILYTKKRVTELPKDDSFFLYFVLAGSLRLNTPSSMLDYVAEQCSISKIDTPTSGTVLTPSSNNDFIAAVHGKAQYHSCTPNGNASM